MEALKGLAQLPRLGLGAEALEGLLGGLAGLARCLGGAGLFGVGVGGEGDQIRAVVLGDAGLGLGRLGLGLWLAGRLRAAGVSGPYGLGFGLGCSWLFGSLGRLGLPCRGLVGRERLRGGGRLAGGTFRLGLLGWLLVGRLRATGGSGPYGRPFRLGLLDRGRLLLLGRCLF